jgi:hypothetical protein
MTTRSERLKYLKGRISEVELRMEELKKELAKESNVRKKMCMQQSFKTNRDVLAMIQDEYNKTEAGL